MDPLPGKCYLVTKSDPNFILFFFCVVRMKAKKGTASLTFSFSLFSFAAKMHYCHTKSQAEVIALKRIEKKNMQQHLLSSPSGTAVITVCSVLPGVVKIFLQMRMGRKKVNKNGVLLLNLTEA